MISPKSHETHMIHRRWFVALSLPCFAIAPPAVAEFAGRVVGVSDGDTITVLRDRTQVRIRLYGIDCPETGQDFGFRAKQFTAELAFGKVVKVVPRDRDRYGRIVAEVVLPDGRVLNDELVKAGLAWWYRQHAQNIGTLPQLEAESPRSEARPVVATEPGAALGVASDEARGP